MTSPNWYDKEPYRKLEQLYIRYGNGKEVDTMIYVYDVPLIIEKAKEMHSKHFCAYKCKGCLYKWWSEDLNYNFCPHCGTSIDWS